MTTLPTTHKTPSQAKFTTIQMVEMFTLASRSTTEVRMLPQKSFWLSWLAMLRLLVEKFLHRTLTPKSSSTSPTTALLALLLSHRNTFMPTNFRLLSTQWSKRKCSKNWPSTWRPVSQDLCSPISLLILRCTLLPPQTPPRAHTLSTALPTMW